jgi:type VI secretion system protein ImpJ
MAAHSVHWHEGMFFCPHHMQRAERLGLEQVHLGQKWNQHYNWGLRALDLDLDALTTGRFVARALKARLRDGTPVAVPEDTILPALDLGPALEAAGPVTVYLAVPLLEPGKANALELEEQAAGAEPGDRRFLVDEQEVEDENTGDNPQPLRIRLLNAKLLLSTQSLAGYETLAVARFRLSDGAERVPELDAGYIPALLSCDAWPPLRAGILEAVYDYVGRKAGTLAGQVLSRGISFDTRHPGAAERLGQLDVLNEAAGLLTVVAFAEGFHPLPAYLELCRLVGQLAVFGASRRVPELPRYDHDDLGGCFYRVKLYVDDLLKDIKDPTYESRPFVGDEQGRLQVALEEKWLQPAWQTFVGVRSPLEAEEVIRLLTEPGLINMKIGSVDRVDDIFRGGRKGLEFVAAPSPPQTLPVEAGLVYFQVNRAAQLEEWQNVEQSRTLAIRLKRILGSIQGKCELPIMVAGQSTTMQFTLYLVSPEG